jgi:hypothetical protein
VCCIGFIELKLYALLARIGKPKISRMKVHVVSQNSPKLLDRIRTEIRLRHYSLRTEQAYVDWARRYILFHGKQHPQALGAEAVRDFLSYLASERHISASSLAPLISKPWSVPYCLLSPIVYCFRIQER